MSQLDWLQFAAELSQALVSGLVVALVIFWLDERRAKRERRLSDYRIACNWHTTRPRISLRNFDLTRANLSGHTFIRANLEGAVLKQTALWGTNFRGANLREVNFKKARLVGANLSQANAVVADFSDATITRRSDPDDTRVPDFSHAVLRGSKFNGSRLNGLKLVKADLRRTDFTGAIVLGCDFTGANLTKSKWMKVKRVENCIWRNVVIDKPENFPPRLWQEIQNERSAPQKRRQVAGK